MVDGERNIHADDLTNLRNVLLKEVEALVGKVEAGKRVRDVMHIVCRVADAALFNGLQRAAAGVVTVSFKRAGRRHDRTGHIRNLHQPQIHLEEGEPQLHALLEAPAGLCAEIGRASCRERV